MLNKKIYLNLALMIITFFVPLAILKKFQLDYQNINFIQSTVFIVMFFGGLSLFILNKKTNSSNINKKWLRIGFQTLGIFELLFALLGLYLIYTFSHGIGF